jgi:nitroimidazol reductase NimA-like FMN-containing flavoprotein (pyridoxamine 5'-phosphate oxidase superfamily)
LSTEEPAAELLTAGNQLVIPWADARARLSESRFYWLATTGSNGGPHVRPVLAVWVDDALHSTSNPTAVKARNLGHDPHAAFTVQSDGLDLVYEGRATKVIDEAMLHQVADVYISKYEWPVTVRDGAFQAPYGAPTAGPPPYEVYRFAPDVVFGFGTDDELAPRSTRWRF